MRIADDGNRGRLLRRVLIGQNVNHREPSSFSTLVNGGFRSCSLRGCAASSDKYHRNTCYPRNAIAFSAQPNAGNSFSSKTILIPSSPAIGPVQTSSTYCWEA